MRPLEGITVVSIEQAVAAPFATRHLADLGARVIKVERPSGDFARNYDTSVHGQSSYFVWLNRNKESVVIDLKDEQGKELLWDLVEHADIFVQNLAPGAVDRMGFSYAEVAKVNPEVIYASISGYGEDGPYAQKKAYDLLVACEAGLVSITGTQDEPSRVGISVVDIATGSYTFSGILAALIQRFREGGGDYLNVSLIDSIGEWMGQPYLFTRYSGKEIRRSGANHVTIAPYGPVQTSDGAVFLSVQNQAEWIRFCEIVLGSPEISDKPEFVTNEMRVAHREELSALLEERFKRHTTDDVISLLEEAGVANAVLRSVESFGEHPQLEHRNRWMEVGTETGMARVIKPPVVATRFDYRADPVPALGQHTERIREEFIRGSGR